MKEIHTSYGNVGRFKPVANAVRSLQAPSSSFAARICARHRVVGYRQRHPLLVYLIMRRFGLMGRTKKGSAAKVRIEQNYYNFLALFAGRLDKGDQTPGGGLTNSNVARQAIRSLSSVGSMLRAGQRQSIFLTHRSGPERGFVARRHETNSSPGDGRSLAGPKESAGGPRRPGRPLSLQSVGVAGDAGLFRGEFHLPAQHLFLAMQTTTSQRLRSLLSRVRRQHERSVPFVFSQGTSRRLAPGSPGLFRTINQGLPVQQIYVRQGRGWQAASETAGQESRSPAVKSGWIAKQQEFLPRLESRRIPQASTRSESPVGVRRPKGMVVRSLHGIVSYQAAQRSGRSLPGFAKPLSASGTEAFTAVEGVHNLSLGSGGPRGGADFVFSWKRLAPITPGAAAVSDPGKIVARSQPIFQRPTVRAVGPGNASGPMYRKSVHSQHLSQVFGLTSPGTGPRNLPGAPYRDAVGSAGRNGNRSLSFMHRLTSSHLGGRGGFTRDIFHSGPSRNSTVFVVAPARGISRAPAAKGGAATTMQLTAAAQHLFTLRRQEGTTDSGPRFAAQHHDHFAHHAWHRPVTIHQRRLITKHGSLGRQINTTYPALSSAGQYRVPTDPAIKEYVTPVSMTPRSMSSLSSRPATVPPGRPVLYRQAVEGRLVVGKMRTISQGVAAGLMNQQVQHPGRRNHRAAPMDNGIAPKPGGLIFQTAAKGASGGLSPTAPHMPASTAENLMAADRSSSVDFREAAGHHRQPVPDEEMLKEQGKKIVRRYLNEMPQRQLNAIAERVYDLLEQRLDVEQDWRGLN